MVFPSPSGTAVARPPGGRTVNPVFKALLALGTDVTLAVAGSCGDRLTNYWRLALLAAAVIAGRASAEPGDHYMIVPGTLPPPNSTHPDTADPRFVQLRDHHPLLKLPNGFKISVFAEHLGHARWLAVAPNGDIFLSEQGPGRITLLRDATGEGRATTITTYAKGFKSPHGLAFHDGALYVADVRAVWRLPYADGDVSAQGEPVRVTQAPDLRTEGWHQTREIAFDRKGQLFLTIGARADVSESDPAPDATVQIVHPDGSMTEYAGGLRNVVGLAFPPGTDELWGTVNERDTLGARLPPDFLTSIHKGEFFGWPYAYDGPHPDPVFGARRPDLVARTKSPDVLFEAHSAPLGLVFYDGAQFPAAYRGDAFVALHATGPYDAPDGYKVVRVRFANGKAVGGYEDFVTGFWDRAEFAHRAPGKPGAPPSPITWGTPCGLAIAKDGSLLIADDLGKTVWRVSYTGE